MYSIFLSFVAKYCAFIFCEWDVNGNEGGVTVTMISSDITKMFYCYKQTLLPLQKSPVGILHEKSYRTLQDFSYKIPTCFSSVSIGFFYRIPIGLYRIYIGFL